MKRRCSITLLLAGLSLPLASQTVQKNADVAKDTLHVIGHSHMDMNWLWTLSETEKMAHDNLRQAVAFMEEYPDYQSRKDASNLLAACGLKATSRCLRARL